MGLGKTIQSISVLKLGKDSARPHLIISPLRCDDAVHFLLCNSLIFLQCSVLHHWKQEIQRVWPDCRLSILHASVSDMSPRAAAESSGEKSHAISAYSSLGELPAPAEVVLTTFEAALQVAGESSLKFRVSLHLSLVQQTDSEAFALSFSLLTVRSLVHSRCPGSCT